MRWLFMLALLAIMPSAPAVRVAGTAQTKAPGNGIIVPVSGVTPGDTLLILAANLGGGTESGAATDDAGNTYTPADIGAGSIGLAALMATNVQAPAQITVTFTIPGKPRAVTVLELAGGTTFGAHVRQALLSETVDTGTVQASGTILIGMIVVNGPPSDAIAVDSAWTPVGRVGTSGGMKTSNITINPIYRVITPGDYSATATITKRIWDAILIDVQ